MEFQDFFLAPCFRDPDAPHTVMECTYSSIQYYTNILVTVAAIVAFSYIVYSGYMMLTAFGDEAKYTSAKKTLQFAIIGFMIALLSGFLINIFVRVLGYTGT